MGKLPYFPCYARDVLSSSKIALMSGDAFKAYWILLCASWLEDERATLPSNEANLEALARVNASTWLKIKDEVLACFDTAGNGRLFSPRLLEVSLLQEKRREAGSKGGSKTQANYEATCEANFKQTTKRQSQSSESELEPEKKKKDIVAKAPVPQSAGNARDLLKHFGERYKDYFDHEYNASFTKEGKLLKDLIAHYDYETVFDNINRFFDQIIPNDRWAEENPTVGVFHSKWNSIQAGAGRSIIERLEDMEKKDEPKTIG